MSVSINASLVSESLSVLHCGCSSWAVDGHSFTEFRFPMNVLFEKFWIFPFHIGPVWTIKAEIQELRITMNQPVTFNAVECQGF